MNFIKDRIGVRKRQESALAVRRRRGHANGGKPWLFANDRHCRYGSKRALPPEQGGPLTVRSARRA